MLLDVAEKINVTSIVLESSEKGTNIYRKLGFIQDKFNYKTIFEIINGKNGKEIKN